MFICYIYRHLCFDNVYMPIKNLNLNFNLLTGGEFTANYLLTPVADKTLYHNKCPLFW